MDEMNPIRKMADMATQKMLAGEQVSDREFHALLAAWQAGETKEAIKELCPEKNGGKKAKAREIIVRQAPTAAGGAGLAMALVKLLEIFGK